MICHLCGTDKLSNEFPHEHLTDDCTEHPLLHCLRCATESVRDHNKCPHPECDSIVDEDNNQYKKYVETLEFLFPTIVETVDGDDVCTASLAHSTAVDMTTSHIVITSLDGEYITLVYDSDQTILSVKDIVEQKLGTPPNKQSLLYNDTELKVHGQNSKVLKLKDYRVQPNSTIYLLVLLYEIPEGFDHVIFDLFWGYPLGNRKFFFWGDRVAVRDYLDASVFLYSGSSFVEVVDYRHRNSQSCSAVRHSGDVMDDHKRLGHHTIHVWIKSIPAHINKLVFTLSAWNSPNISKYPNPSLRFFDAKFPNKQLCDDEMKNAAHSQAIIMCCLIKKEGTWQVFSLKNPSAGNAMNYDPLKKNIVSLIEKGFI